MGIEPTSKAWEALVLPMNYARLLLKSSKQRMPILFIIAFSNSANFNIPAIIRQALIDFVFVL